MINYVTVITTNGKEIFREPWLGQPTPEIALAKMIEAGCKADGANAVTWGSPDGKVVHRFEIVPA